MLKLTESQRRLASRLTSYANPWISAVGEMIRNGGFELAGHLAFTAFLALCPFLIFLAALFGILGDHETAQELVSFLFRFAPRDVAETLSGPIFSVMIAHREDLLTLGILGTLWAASSWFEAMRLALNTAYDIEETRPVWRRRLQSLLFVVLSAFALLVASAAIVLGPLAWKLVERIVPVGPGIGVVWDAGRYLIGAVLFGGFLLALHQYLPPVRQRWRDLLPGIAVTLLFWLAVSTGLSLYLALAGNYDSTYGTLGGVVITLLFFYSAAAVFIFGAELNAAYRPAAGSGAAGRGKAAA
ncbi:MAG: YihY/virulence factor BrkB family protein [Reyranellaceae bacterium]